MKNEAPQEFNEFNDYNFIRYSLSLEDGKNVIEILSNINDILSISLYKDEIEINSCTSFSCKFLIAKELSYQYYIYIKNTKKAIGIKTPKLYILQYQELETYQIPTDKFFLKISYYPLNINFK